MKNPKAMTLFVLAAMLLSSCGTAVSEVAEATETQAQTTAETEPAETEVQDDLPDKKFDGREFHILSVNYCLQDYDVHEETGALMNDATYARNLTVEERFGVKLKTVDGGDHSPTNAVARNAIYAGDTAHDLIVNHMIDTATLSAEGVFAEIGGLKYIHPQKPWWNASAYENLSVKGKTYILAGDISPYYMKYNYVLYFNKNLAEDYNISDEELYSEALAGKWTFDRFNALAAGVYKDLNGNGTADAEDLYGQTQQNSSYITPYLYSFGETTVQMDKEGIPQLSVNTEKFAAMTEKLYKMMYESESTLPSDNWTTHKDTFMSGRALFMNGPLTSASGSFAEMEDDFGMLPMPKWDEAQEEYHTMADGSAPLAAIPQTVKDTEFVGIVTEALAAESYRQITPVLYEVSLKYRGARDQMSMEVIDIAIRTGVVDFGYVFGDYSMMGFCLSELMSKKNVNFASYYAENKAKWETRVSDVVKAFTEEK